MKVWGDREFQGFRVPGIGSITSKVKDTSVLLPSSTTKKAAQHLSDPWNLETTRSTPGISSQPTYWGCQPWVGPGTPGTLQRVLTVMQAALPLQPCDQADPVAVEGSVVGKDLVWSLWQPQGKNHNPGPHDSVARSCHLQWRIICLLRKSIWNIALANNRTLDYWGAKWLCQWTCPLWTESFLTHQVIKSDGHSSSLLKDRSGTLTIEPEQDQWTCCCINR